MERARRHLPYEVLTREVKLACMRKQYHFWPGQRRFDAWDVDRLVDLSSGLPVREVALDSIREVDSNYWFNPGPEPSVRRVIEHGQAHTRRRPLLPIVLAVDKSR